MAQRMEKAFAYLRTSSAANVGGDRDSDRRQRDAIAAFAKRGGYELAQVCQDLVLPPSGCHEDHERHAKIGTRIGTRQQGTRRYGVDQSIARQAKIPRKSGLNVISWDAVGRL